MHTPTHVVIPGTAHVSQCWQLHNHAFSGAAFCDQTIHRHVQIIGRGRCTPQARSARTIPCIQCNATTRRCHQARTDTNSTLTQPETFTYVVGMVVGGLDHYRVATLQSSRCSRRQWSWSFSANTCPRKKRQPSSQGWRHRWCNILGRWQQVGLVLASQHSDPR